MDSKLDLFGDNGDKPEEKPKTDAHISAARTSTKADAVVSETGQVDRKITDTAISSPIPKKEKKKELSTPPPKKQKTNVKTTAISSTVVKKEKKKHLSTPSPKKHTMQVETTAPPSISTPAKQKILFSPEKINKKSPLPSTSTTAVNKHEQTTGLSATKGSTTSPKTHRTQNQIRGYLHGVHERKNFITFELQIEQAQYRHGITFDPDIFRTVMFKVMQEKNPVVIENYNFTPSRLNPGEQDLKLTSKSKITAISQHLHYENKPPTPFTTELAKIATISPNTKINVEVVILGENPTFEMKPTASGPMTMQTKYVADDTAITNLSTWGANVNQIQVNNTYRLEDVSVKFFEKEKHLSTTPQTRITSIPPLTNYVKLETATIHAEIVAIQITTKYRCFSCNHLNAFMSSTATTCRCDHCGNQQLALKAKKIFQGNGTFQTETMETFKLLFTSDTLDDILDAIKASTVPCKLDTNQMPSAERVESFLLEYDDTFTVTYYPRTNIIANLTTSQ